MPKNSIRQYMLTKRRALSPAEVESRSLQVQKSFLQSDEYCCTESLVLYAPIRNEVDTAELRRHAISMGKRVFYPVVDGDVLIFRQFRSSDDLSKGTFGIDEPVKTCPICAPEDIDIIVIPGVAFDLKGSRIGYGKGYYDKTLHLLEGTGKLIGFSYDFQLLNEIIGEPHDVAIDVIFTETRTIRP